MTEKNQSTLGPPSNPEKTSPEAVLDTTQEQKVQEIIERMLLHVRLGEAGIFIISTSNERIKKEIEERLKQGLGDFKFYCLNQEEAQDPGAAMRWLVGGYTKELKALKDFEGGQSVPDQKIAKHGALDPKQTVFVLDLHSSAVPEKINKSIQALNIRREHIVDYKILFLLWLPSEYTSREIIEYGKDFWSFRTTYNRFE